MMVMKYKTVFLYSLKKIVYIEKTVKNKCLKMIRMSQEKEEEWEDSYVVTGITWYLYIS